MATFADDKIISTAGGDVNGNFDWTGLTPGWYRVTLGGTFGSRTFSLHDVDRSDNEFPLYDSDGAAITGLAAGATYEISLGRTLRVKMAGTATALITIEANRLLT